MDYKGLLGDLEFIDLKCHLAAIEGKVGTVINVQRYVEFLRELTAFKKEIARRPNG